MVFQSYALFPHLSVAHNVAFGLSARGVSWRESDRLVESMLKRVDLPGYGQRRVSELSGWERQRVALARALVIEPDVLLMDEPLSNLDERLRKTMRSEIRRIQKESGVTTVYVTHDQEEAVSMADRIVVMESGKVIQITESGLLYREPATPFVARFIGHENIFTVPLDHDCASNPLSISLPANPSTPSTSSTLAAAAALSTENLRSRKISEDGNDRDKERGGERFGKEECIRDFKANGEHDQGVHPEIHGGGHTCMEKVDDVPCITLFGQKIPLPDCFYTQRGYRRGTDPPEYVTVLIPPEEVFQSDSFTGVKAEILSHEVCGSLIIYRLRVGESLLSMEILSRKSTPILESGTIIQISFDPAAVHIIDIPDNRSSNDGKERRNDS